MSDLSNIDIGAYSLFAFTEEKEPIKLEVMTDSGYVNFTGYDSFEIDSGTIICFKNKIYEGFHNIKIVGKNTDYIQIIQNSNVLDTVLNETKKPGYNFYLFLDSTIQEQTYAFNDSYNLESLNLPKDFVRCDYRKLGGSGFYEGKSGYNITSVFYVLSISGIGHIIRIGTSDEGNLNQGSQAEYTAGRTLTAMIKVIYEWSIVAKEPFNNKEKISSSATSFLENLNLDEEIMTDIISSTGDMALARYIKGDTQRSSTIEDAARYEMPESFSNYIKKHYTHTSLYELDKNLNLGILDDDLINNYLNYFEKILFTYFYQNGIDIDSYTNLDQINQLDSIPKHISNYILEYNKVKGLYEQS